MAAGGVDVPRRSFFIGHPKKDYECYRYVTRDSKSSHGGRHGERHQKGSSYHRDSQKHLCHDVSNQRDFVSERLDGQKDCEVHLPPLKKGKFSPIKWDVQDEFVRVPLRNKTEPVGFVASRPRPVGEIPNLITDGVFMESQSSESQVGSEKVTPPAVSPSAEQNGLVDLEEGQIEEEGVFRPPNIATSRWASDLDSPGKETLSDGEDILKTSRWTRNSSSPESGEVLLHESEGQRSRLSTSGDFSDNELEGGTLMDADEAEGDNSDASVQEGMDMLLCSRSVDEYEKLNKINEGTYGVVYRARDKKTGEIVALKKIKLNQGRKDEYGFPLTSLREINILLSCNHPSIVNVKEVVVGNSDSVFMVMEHLEHDLKGLMDQMKQPFSTSEVKCLMMQLLEGLKYLHHNWIVHRDLKPSNLLLNNKGELKICDFGMARQYGSPLKPYTQLVVTQWYRAPELLLGAKHYSTAIDIWSVGCIMAELFSQKPLFQGKGGSDIDQLHKIFGVLGTPSEKIWPGISTLPGAKANFFKQPFNLLRKNFPAASFTGSPVVSDLGFDLLNKLLTYDPEKRIAVDAALNHDWFREVPLPKSKEFMPTFPQRRD